MRVIISILHLDADLKRCSNVYAVCHADNLDNARRDGVERHSAGDLDLKSGCVSAMHADCVDALMHVIGICVSQTHL